LEFTFFYINFLDKKKCSNPILLKFISLIKYIVSNLNNKMQTNINQQSTIKHHSRAYNKFNFSNYDFAFLVRGKMNDALAVFDADKNQLF
jgi:hypothetical protein